MLEGGELLPRDLAKVGALGQVLADEAVGVLVGAALPGAAWVAEEDGHVELGAEDLVLAHLSALVIGHGLAQGFWDGLQPTLETVDDVVGGGAIKFDEHDVAAETLDEGTHAELVVGVLDKITLPMTGTIRAATSGGRISIEVMLGMPPLLRSVPRALGSRVL